MSPEQARALPPGLYQFVDSYGPRIVQVFGDGGYTRLSTYPTEWDWDDLTLLNECRAVPLSVVPIDAGPLLTTAQQLAYAVLSGQTDAIPALLDECLDVYHGGP